MFSNIRSLISTILGSTENSVTGKENLASYFKPVISNSSWDDM